MVIIRKVHVHVYNYTNAKYNLIGDWFQDGGWDQVDGTLLEDDVPMLAADSAGSEQNPSPKKKSKKKSNKIPPTSSEGPGEHTFVFENSNVFTGVAGYATFSCDSKDAVSAGSGPSYVTIAFANPVVGEPYFTARSGKAPVNARNLFNKSLWLSKPLSQERSPANRKKSPDGGKFEFFQQFFSCGEETPAVIWNLDSNDSEHSHLSLQILPMNPRERLRLSEDVRNMAAAADQCWSLDDSKREGNLVSRQIVLRIMNQSKHRFVFDGDWFDSGVWMGKQSTKPDIEPCGSDGKASKTDLKFCSETSLQGVLGACWYVTTHKGKDTFFSTVFSSPLLGEGVFGAWAGNVPWELVDHAKTSEYWSTKCTFEGEELWKRGVSWELKDPGPSEIVMEIWIEPELPAFDPDCIPEEYLKDQFAEEEAQKQIADDQNTAAAAAKGNGVYANGNDSGYPNAGERENDGTTAEVDPNLPTTLVDPSIGAHGDPQEDLDRIANETRPRDLLTGIGTGLAFAGAGIAAGATSLVAMPYQGASEDGVGGFFTGLGKGLLTATGCVVGGAVGLGTQIVRGAINTPDAIKYGLGPGRFKWDPEKGQWVDATENLRADAEKLAAEPDTDDEAEAAAAEGAKGGEHKPRKVVDSSLYDTIGVATTATQGEIKKAYYKKAMLTHPDKNKEDPEAQQKFQALASAYQVLSEPESRKRYDLQGMSGVDQQQMPQIDAVVFFGMLFGTESFEPYIGKMQVASTLNTFMKEMGKMKDDGPADQEVAHEEFKARMGVMESKVKNSESRRKWRREVKCALSLLDKIDIYVVERDEERFLSNMALECEQLRTGAYGGQMLEAIGFIYTKQSEMFLAEQRGETTIANSAQSGWREFAGKAKVGGTGVQAMLKVRELSAKMHELELDKPPVEGAEPNIEAEMKKREQSQQLMEQMVPILMDLAFEYSLTDIESNCRRVCEKLFYDVSVPWILRIRRAEAVLLVGQLFTDSSGSNLQQEMLGPDGKPLSAKQRVELALSSAVARAREDEDTAGN